MLPQQRAQVQSLVRKLSAHMPHSVAKKKMGVVLEPGRPSFNSAT